MGAWHFQGSRYYHTNTFCPDSIVILLRDIDPRVAFTCVPGKGGKPHCPTCAVSEGQIVIAGR